MPDRWNFDHLADRGDITVACIEDNCDARGPLWKWSIEKRSEHHSMHHPAKASVDDDFLASLPTIPLFPQGS